MKSLLCSSLHPHGTYSYFGTSIHRTIVFSNAHINDRKGKLFSVALSFMLNFHWVRNLHSG